MEAPLCKVCGEHHWGHQPHWPKKKPEREPEHQRRGPGPSILLTKKTKPRAARKR